MALITATQARLFIPTLTTSATDTDLDTFIARAGKMMASWCDYPRASASADPTLESATYTLYSGGYSGAIEVAADGRLLLPVRPVTAVTSIHDDADQGYGAAYLVSASDYTTDANDGVIRLLPTATHGGFSTTPYALKVVVVAGFATVPIEVQHACGMVVRELWNKKSAGHAQSVSSGGSSVQMQQHAIPVEAQEILAPYRQYRGVAA